MANGLTALDRFPEEKQRLRRALSRLGIQTADPSGLVITDGGIAVLPQAPIFVDASGVGLDYSNGLVLSGTSLVVDSQSPLFVDASGVGLVYDTSYFGVVSTELTIVNPITDVLVTTSTITIDSDSSCLYLGDGQDMSLCYDGTDGIINTSLVAASDLIVTCGAAKTLELTTPVYKDINVFGGTLSGPPGLQPGVANFIDNLGADTDIATFGIAVGEGLSSGFEIPHDYKEGTDFVFHVCFEGITAPTDTDKVKWQLTYFFVADDATVPPKTVVVKEIDYDTQYEMIEAQFDAISGSGVKITDHLVFTVERIAASQDEYAGEALIGIIGFHYQANTLGSRQITTK